MADAADKAGGEEVIYSSEGPDPLPKPVPPVPVFAANDSEQEQEIDPSSIPVEQAFESFAGKLYAVPGYRVSNISSETPLQRLGRLQKELEQVEQDLSPYSSSFNDASLRQVVEELRHKLSVVAESGPRSDLSLLEIPQRTPPIPSSSTTTTTTEMSQLEHRLLRLEQAVGSSSELPFSSRLRQLEQLSAQLTEPQLEALSKKAKVLRQDLEAASKARNKLMTSLSHAEDAKSITDLYDQMVSLSGMTTHLPALVSRLQALARLHQSSAQWATQLSHCTHAVSQLQSQVTAVETSVERLATSVQENVAQMEQNVRALEARCVTKDHTNHDDA